MGLSQCWRRDVLFFFPLRLVRLPPPARSPPPRRHSVGLSDAPQLGGVSCPRTHGMGVSVGVQLVRHVLHCARFVGCGLGRRPTGLWCGPFLLRCGDSGAWHSRGRWRCSTVRHSEAHGGGRCPSRRRRRRCRYAGTRGKDD